jgi:hypothetical protein
MMSKLKKVLRWGLIAIFPFFIINCQILSSILPMGDENLENLQISPDLSSGIQPGESRTFKVGVMECCYVFKPIETKVRWSVSLVDGVSLDPNTGVFFVEPDTDHGRIYEVTASIQGGRKVITSQVYVVRKEANPLIGFWREKSQLTCDTFSEVAPEEPIREFQFKADGKFYVTWMPFEIYHDYWGTYSFDINSGILDLVMENGNYKPEDFSGNGKFSISEKGELILENIWLGSPYESEVEANCGHIFVRP